MKKRTRWAALLLAAALILALVGCQQAAVEPEPTLTALTEVTPSPSTAPASSPSPSPTDDPKGNTESLDANGSYDSKEDVALYIHTYGELPDNYITKDEAEDLGWNGGSVERYAPGMCIGGDCGATGVGRRRV